MQVKAESDRGPRWLTVQERLFEIILSLLFNKKETVTCRSPRKEHEANTMRRILSPANSLTAETEKARGGFSAAGEMAGENRHYQSERCCCGVADDRPSGAPPFGILLDQKSRRWWAKNPLAVKTFIHFSATSCDFLSFCEACAVTWL